jgi:hypothetical protein
VMVMVLDRPSSSCSRFSLVSELSIGLGIA